MDNYYLVLGIQQDANDAEIKKAYRNLAKQYHPDIVGDDPVKRKQFDEITKAYEILSDKKRREEYDNSFVVKRKPVATPPDFADMFDNFFGKSQNKAKNEANKEQKIKTDEIFQSFFRVK